MHVLVGMVRPPATAELVLIACFPCMLQSDAAHVQLLNDDDAMARTHGRGDRLREGGRVVASVFQLHPFSGEFHLISACSC